MKDRFDLEAAIMDVWATKDHLDKVIWRMIDHPEVMSEDQIWNHLEAVKQNIDLHCEKLMDTFCQVFELNEYATAEMKALRAQMLNTLTTKADKEDKVYPCKTPCGDIDCMESCGNPKVTKKAKKK